MASAAKRFGPEGEVDLKFFSPGRAVEVARRAASVASDIQAMEKLGVWVSELHWGPLDRILHGMAGSGLSRHGRNLVRSLVSGTHWPQAGLAKRPQKCH
eukprot:7537105-Pyramimonas_sp.AAC.1